MYNKQVVKFAQELLRDEPRSSITPGLISEKISQVLLFNPKWTEGFDQNAAVDELIRRFGIWVGGETVLESNEGHIKWLDADRKMDWRYWQRYREYSEGKMSDIAVDTLDRATDRVLGLLEDPQREGAWDRRGLVAGHVQSGKTGNYTGLICKAADAGYKIIIVLAGIHNNLRAQTQMRLDEGFLGYETHPDPNLTPDIGVGLIDRDISIRPNYVTNRTEGGDFTAGKDIRGISPEQRPWLFVVKKNKTILERLLNWINKRVADAEDPETGRKLVTKLPLLVIDDEADNASVDVGEQAFNDDGTPDPEHQPKTINRLIRQILFAFTRSAYVGYTATPFANIFIHEQGSTRTEGPDLFPAAFIVNLGAPSNYIGPAQIFGLKNEQGRSDGLPLFREVDDHTTEDRRGGWMPHTHKNGWIPHTDRETDIPASLETAIHSFLLSCAVRRLRGQGDAHTSMLIHVTRFASVQTVVHERVANYVDALKKRLKRRVDHQSVEAALESLWKSDFVPTSATTGHFKDLTDKTDLPEWEQVIEALPLAIEDIDVRKINGTAKDALDYADSGKGLKVIAIGGDKLSRGLTLEGLCTSYFLRTSRMYDTLMQMGRWFGYRPGYVDLCRLYTTSELKEWFGHIADAAEELRAEFDIMAGSGSTPRDYGLKVQSHPILMVTSRLKMRSAKSLHLSFSGTTSETVAFFKDKDTLQSNLDMTSRFISELGRSEPIPDRERDGKKQTWDGHIWKNVDASDVIGFIETYRTHPDAYKVNSRTIADFIAKMVQQGELTSWTVAVIGSSRGTPIDLTPDLTVRMVQRSGTLEDNRFAIGRLLSPRDETIDLDEDAWRAALSLTRSSWQADPGRRKAKEEPDEPSGVAARRVRGLGAEGIAPRPEKGLLLIYLIDPDKSLDQPSDIKLPPIVAIGVSFPSSRNGAKIEYKVNNVLWEQEFASAD